MLRLPIEGEKRRRVLAVIAAFQDEGHQPSLAEIAERANLDRGWRQAQALVLRLERGGLLRVRWVGRGGQARWLRNRYELLLP